MIEPIWAKNSDCIIAVIIQSEFLTLGSSMFMTKSVEKQLSNYNYTFLRSSNVSVAFHVNSG